jgi:hypothetical protein
MTFDNLVRELGPYLPPAFGALIGLRYAREQTPVQKLSSFASGFGLAVWCGPARAELLALGPKATIAAGILIAIVGMDIVGGLIVAARQFGQAPAASVRGWLDTWLGKEPPQ